jgi:hypothetical protein
MDMELDNVSYQKLTLSLRPVVQVTSRYDHSNDFNNIVLEKMSTFKWGKIQVLKFLY